MIHEQGRVTNSLAYLEHISTSSILLAYDRLERPVAPLSGTLRIEEDLTMVVKGT